MPTDDLTLKVGGMIYGGWKSVSVRRGIAQLSGGFEVSLTERWPTQPQRRKIDRGQACEVAIGGEVVITGNVDEVEPSFDAEQHGVRITGRDATGNLVDCSVASKPGEWWNRDLLQIVKELCGPFNIPVGSDTDIGAQFLLFRVEEGEKVYDAIERMCRQRGILPMSDGKGGLILTRADRAVHVPVMLQQGVNIVSASGTYSIRERFSSYTVKGQRSGFDDPDQNAQVTNTATDDEISRYRPLVILSEEQAGAASFADRASWERNVRRGRSQKVSVTVQGWRHPAGIWAPLSTVRVVSDWLAIDTDMLIEAVTLRRDDRGSFAELSLVLPAAYDLIAWPASQKDIQWGEPN